MFGSFKRVCQKPNTADTIVRTLITLLCSHDCCALRIAQGWLVVVMEGVQDHLQAQHQVNLISRWFDLSSR